MDSFDKLVYSSLHTFGITEQDNGTITWFIGPDMVRGAVEMAMAGNDHAEYHGVSLAMINQQLPEVLRIEGW